MIDEIANQEDCKLEHIVTKDGIEYCKNQEECFWKVLGKDYSFHCAYTRYQKEMKLIEAQKCQ